MESKDAIEKIKKLLKLSESPYEEEAKIALEKARKLMVQFHIEENDLSEEQRDNVVQEDVKVSDAMISLWFYIAKNNRCMCYEQDRYNWEIRRREHYMILVGYQFDIDCVKMMMNYIENCFNVGLKDIRQKIRNGECVNIDGEIKVFDRFESTAGLKNAYLAGFTRGLKEIIAEQNAKSEYHLMVITPEEVKDDYKERTSGMKMGTYSNRRTYYQNNNTELISHISHADGRDAGKRRELEA